MGGGGSFVFIGLFCFVLLSCFPLIIKKKHAHVLVNCAVCSDLSGVAVDCVDSIISY